ncbi:MAG: hypothetical protein NZO58_01650 [Gemmataceae bacterium]|nr:hypothetical protein [Gemmataceae bacterium]
MLRYLLDTDHLTLLEHQHPVVSRNIRQQPQGTVALCAVTIEESLRGRLAAIAQARDGPQRIKRYATLLASLALLQQFPIAPYDQSAENESQAIRKLRLPMGTRAQKIAAIALAHRLTVVTRNRSDFARIPGLSLVDWSV